jgi:hypothetical protein
MEDNNNQIPVVPIIVSTGFFHREAMMYALGDIKFNKPKSLKTLIYTVILIIIYSIPMAWFVVGLDKTFSNVFFASIVFGPSLLIGNLANKPIFNGKSMIKYFSSYFKYLSHPKLFCDLFPYESFDEQYVDFNIWIADES